MNVGFCENVLITVGRESSSSEDFSIGLIAKYDSLYRISISSFRNLLASLDIYSQDVFGFA